MVFLWLDKMTKYGQVSKLWSPQTPPLHLDHKQVPMNGQVNLSVTVTNSGQRAGKEVVLLYVRERVASLSPAGKRVKRY